MAEEPETTMDHTLPWAEHESTVGPVAKSSAKIDRDGAGQVDAASVLPHRRVIIALSAFAAVSAIAGGAALVVWRAGSPFLPLDLIRYTPFTSFVVPGLLLAIVIGGASLASAALAWRRRRVAVDVTLLAGGALTVWIVAEVAMLRGFHWLHALYGVVGVALLALGTYAASRSGELRHRWVVSVTFAEAVGFAFPMCAGVLSARASLAVAPSMALVVAAGLVEGLALGTGQARAFPFPVRRARYALFTSLAAGTVWACILSVARIAGARTVQVIVMIVIAILAAIIGLAAIGAPRITCLARCASASSRE